MKIEESNPGIRALQRASRIAEENGISDMSLEEINAEIAEAKRERTEAEARKDEEGTA